MKKYLVGFMLGVTLTLGTIFLIPKPIAMPEPTPQIVYRDKIITKEVIKEVEKFTDLETVAKNVKNSCVMIYAYKGNVISQGSGVVHKGYVITAKHVVKGFDKIEVFTDDEKNGFYGTIHYIDPDLDVAIIKATTGQKSVTLGDSDILVDGEKLVSITSPMGVLNAIDECVNSGFTKFDSETLLAISESTMTSGSSGGAIFNQDSELIAMSIQGEKNVNYAIPINDLKPILQTLK